MPGRHLFFYFVVGVEGFRRLIATRAMIIRTTTITRTSAASFVTEDMAIGSVRLSGTSCLLLTVKPSLMYAFT